MSDPSHYVTSHPGQLVLSLPSLVGAVNTDQRTVIVGGWEGNYWSGGEYWQLLPEVRMYMSNVHRRLSA